ncbi:DDB1- and CUL4-associated factor 17-like [Elysia marginata]|uniref:DDB1- and CUL4-associated factor 17-like n=1 Tax=Elysia marginata TaxID=1093978 RepID=A0AAV4EN18_9GAST|nr:DDB1- and CUL4-associated factor 17-like [Elysia marginata]
MQAAEPHFSAFDKRNNNVCCMLVQREYLLHKSQRRSCHVLRSLLTKCDYTFHKVWWQTSSQRISCDGALIFLKNYSQCVDSSAFHPRVKFQVSQVSASSKITDALLTEGYPETMDLPHKGYRASMLALTKGNLLLRMDLQNGHLLEQIYVGFPIIKFRTIQWNVVGESVTLISQIIPPELRTQRLEAGQELHPDRWKQIVILSLFPLQFVCKFSVSRQVFGRHVLDVSVFLDLLTVMHSSGHVRMYSMETILKQYQYHSYNLRQPMSDRALYGVYPSPLTENVEIKELPPCLFEVRCRNRDVMLTLPPCYYLMWPYKEEIGVCCFSFETGQMVRSGCISKEEASAYDDRIALHADDSGRVVHMTNSQLRLLKLKRNEEENFTELVEEFVISRNIEPKPPSLKVTQSGRIIKQRVLPDAVDLPDRTVLTMVYSEEQDMIVLLSLQHEDCATVGFYDNWNGCLLRQFPLEENVEEALERSICFYLDTLVHAFKTQHGQFECHVYKLQPLSEVADISLNTG